MNSLVSSAPRPARDPNGSMPPKRAGITGLRSYEEWIGKEPTDYTWPDYPDSLVLRFRGGTPTDVAYVGQHQYDILQQVDLNRVDFGAAFLPENRDPSLAAVLATEGVEIAREVGQALALMNRGYTLDEVLRGVSAPATAFATARAGRTTPARDALAVALGAAPVIERRWPEANASAARAPAPDRPARAGRRWPAARPAGSAASAATAVPLPMAGVAIPSLR